MFQNGWMDGVGPPSGHLIQGYRVPSSCPLPGLGKMVTCPPSPGTSQSVGDMDVQVIMTVQGFALHY